MLQLRNIKIENFRSIKSLTVDVETIDGKSCSMLFGVNEVGKSNILKAIASLSPTTKITYDTDCFREAKKNSDRIQIRYNFEVKEYIKELLKEEKIPSELIKNITNLEILISIDSNSTRTESVLFYYKNKTVLKKYAYDTAHNTIVSKTDELEELTEDEADKHFKTLFEKKILDKRPKIIYWEPSDKYLITKPVDLNQFKANPDAISIPLKNMFNLMDVENGKIQSYVDMILKNPDDLDDFETQMSQKVTEHLNELWNEHKIEIKVKVNGTSCSVHVKDKQQEVKRSFSMAQRSDGFKQFVSILLNLSIESRKGDLENALIILDEPEVHLHPSGVKYLRNELLKISENNTVFLASHSIYMVDKLSLNRNKIVEKEQGISNLISVDKNCPIEEEVVYEALGTSILELIEPNLLLFEGSTDRDAYEVFAQKFKKDLDPPIMRTVAATGTKNMPKYAKFFKNKFVTGFMAVDSDAEGESVLKAVKKEEPEIAKNIFRIKDIITTLKKDSLTLEDLFPKRVIEQSIKNIYGKEINIDETKPIIHQIKSWKKTEGLQDKDGKLEDLKSNLIKLVISEIKTQDETIVKKDYKVYYNYVDKLIKKIKNTGEK